ncbi:MAG: GNAT family N-acetyltransferase [Bacteroidia bacterium]|nr:GNAT family N-acetyltransferase [Bacteroidia bacterium]
MNLIIRPARKNDMPEVLSLIKELAVFEKEPDAVELTNDELIRDGFKENPEFVCLVAEMDNKIVGMALAYKRYSTWTGKVLHLEDLIVKRESRGMQIGTKLLDEIVKYGYNTGVKRISWEVLDWNQPAIEFYNKKGAKIKEDWRVVHLDKKAINKYISKL